MSTEPRQPTLPIKVALAAVTGVFAGTARAVISWLMDHLTTGH